MFDKILPMTGFEPWISSVGGDRSTNWATTPDHATLLNPSKGKKYSKAFWDVWKKTEAVAKDAIPSNR